MYPPLGSKKAAEDRLDIVKRFPQEVLVRIFGYLSPNDVENCR